MKLDFRIKLTAKDLYIFNMKQTYSGFSGWLSLALAAVFFWMAVTDTATRGIGYVFLYLGGGLIVLLYNPVTLWLRVRQIVVKDPVLSNALDYSIDDEGVHVSQGEESALLKWDQVYKVRGGQKQTLIYSTRINAYIIPTEQIGDNYARLKEIAEKNLPGYRVKMK